MTSFAIASFCFKLDAGCMACCSGAGDVCHFYFFCFPCLHHFFVFVLACVFQQLLANGTLDFWTVLLLV